MPLKEKIRILGFYQYRDEVLTRPQPSKILEQKVKEGNFGKKTGYGFYHYK